MVLYGHGKVLDWALWSVAVKRSLGFDDGTGDTLWSSLIFMTVHWIFGAACKIGCSPSDMHKFLIGNSQDLGVEGSIAS